MSLYDTPKVTLYHAASRGGRKQWSIWIEPDGVTVTVEYGLEGGALRTSSDTAKPKGRAGSKAFKDSAQVAAENYERQIRKKREEGYREDGEAEDVVDYLLALDKNFVPAKPLTKQDDSLTLQMERDGRLWIQRKRDGRRHIALKTKTGTWRIYSRRMEELTGHLAHIVDALNELPIPNGSILDGEVIVVGADGRDDYKVTGRFTNPASDPKSAAALAKSLNAQFMVFDVLYWNGNPCWALPYSERYEHAYDCMAVGDADETVFLSPNLDESFETLQQVARNERWEGLILWAKNEGSRVSIGGKPKRCNSAKWKPIQERDFIAKGWFYGSGLMSKVVGGFFLAEYAPDGTLRDCGKVGTGLDDQMRNEALTWEYPCVLAIKFDQQEPTGKLRFPVVLKKHEDKLPEDCVGPELEDGDDE